MDNKEVIKHIEEARDLFLKHKEERGYTDNNAWYYLGVFDALFGLLDNPPKMQTHDEDDEDLTQYLTRILDEFSMSFSVID